MDFRVFIAMICQGTDSACESKCHTLIATSWDRVRLISGTASKPCRSFTNLLGLQPLRDQMLSSAKSPPTTCRRPQPKRAIRIHVLNIKVRVPIAIVLESESCDTGRRDARLQARLCGREGRHGKLRTDGVCLPIEADGLDRGVREAGRINPENQNSIPRTHALHKNLRIGAEWNDRVAAVSPLAVAGAVEFLGRDAVGELQ